jgi:hypothetical protein
LEPNKSLAIWVAVRPGFSIMIFSTSSSSIGGPISVHIRLIAAGVVRATLDGCVARSCFSFGSLQVGLYFNSPRHQFAARYL